MSVCMNVRLKNPEGESLRFDGTAESIQAIEAAFGKVDSVWSDCLVVGGRTVAVGQYLVQLPGCELQVFSEEGFQAHLSVVA